MKKNDNKGFTLIELLAVIIILAVVAVIGTTTVLPYIQNARKDAFKTEVNYAVDAAVQAVQLKSIGAIGGEIKRIKFDSNTENAYCINLEDLVNWGLWTKNKSEVGNGKDYDGEVYILDDNTKIVAIKNKEFIIDYQEMPIDDVKIEAVKDKNDFQRDLVC